MTESNLHLAMKHWIADKYKNIGVPSSSIEFEKMYKDTRDNKPTRTTADVVINTEGGVAVYCQTKNDYNWLYDFLEKRLPIIKKHCKKAIVVFPQNLEMLFPLRHQDYCKLLKEENVDVLIAPCNVDIKNKSKVRIDMTYKALQKLCDLKNKHSPPDKLLMEFIEKDLEKLVKNPGGVV